MATKSTETKKCKICPKRFISVKYWQSFCSEECRNKFHADVRKEATRLYKEKYGEN